MMRALRLPWLWPALVLLSVVLVGLAVFVLPNIAVRPLIVFWFLFVCPGAALVRFLRIQEPVSVATLAVAISLSLDALIAGCQLYAGHWSPELTLAILMTLTVACLAIQVLYPSIKPQKEAGRGAVDRARDSSPESGPNSVSGDGDESRARSTAPLP